MSSAAVSAHTILLVEDDPNDILLIQRAFNKAHVANPLQVAKDGERAIDYLKEAQAGQGGRNHPTPVPVLVLLDLKLPRRSGLEVLQWLKAEPSLRRIPVVVLTSSQQMVDINRAYDLGVNSYLVKPVTFDSLIEIVKTLGLYWIILNEQPEV